MSKEQKFDWDMDDEVTEVHVERQDIDTRGKDIPIFYDASLIGYAARTDLGLKDDLDFLVASTVPESLVFDNKKYTKMKLNEDQIIFDNCWSILANGYYPMSATEIDNIIYKNIEGCTLVNPKAKVSEEKILKEALKSLSLPPVQVVYPEIKGFAAFNFVNSNPVQELISELTAGMDATNEVCTTGENSEE
jgi:hypothetical protein